MNNTNSGLSRFFIAELGCLPPLHRDHEWVQWEVVDRCGQDRVCFTSCEQKAEFIRDALEAFYKKELNERECG